MFVSSLEKITMAVVNMYTCIKTGLIQEKIISGVVQTGMLYTTCILLMAYTTQYYMLHEVLVCWRKFKISCRNFIRKTKSAQSTDKLYYCLSYCMTMNHLLMRCTHNGTGSSAYQLITIKLLHHAQDVLG